MNFTDTQEIINALTAERFGAKLWKKGGYTRVYVSNNSGRGIGYLEVSLDEDYEISDIEMNLSANRSHVSQILGI